MTSDFYKTVDKALLLEKHKPVSTKKKPEDFPGSSAVKNPPAMQETPISFLGQEDPLKKGYTTYSSMCGLP